MICNVRVYDGKHTRYGHKHRRYVRVNGNIMEIRTDELNGHGMDGQRMSDGTEDARPKRLCTPFPLLQYQDLFKDIWPAEVEVSKPMGINRSAQTSWKPKLRAERIEHLAKIYKIFSGLKRLTWATRIKDHQLSIYV
ncbi:hypothetical protein EV424DRAFT_1343126 [Suillus variegatus]|nr:hypothetical protein EV424DRAFT_1343126 [Suillus variegatus]